MKNLVIFMLGLLIPILIFAQDIEQTPFEFDYETADGQQYTDQALDPDLFPQDEYLMGFQWWGTGKMMKAMGMNSIAEDAIPHDTANESNIPIKLIIQPGKFGEANNLPYIRNAVCMQYEPGLEADTNGQFNTFPNDPSNPIFGFVNIHSDTDTASNFNDNHYSGKYSICLIVIFAARSIITIVAFA